VRAARLPKRHGKPDEQGAILILVVFLTVTIVAMAALVIDVGAMLDERRQLQNGADAGALAAAKTCSLGPCDPVQAASLASSLANANSRDGKSTAVVTYPGANQVRVTTTTSSSSGSILPYAFGRVLGGAKGRTLRATATASWTLAAPSTATAVPIAVSDCEAGTLVVGTAAVILFTKPIGTCLLKYPAGNFGWLDAPCPDTYTVGVAAPGDPGKSGPKTCLDSRINTDVTFPVFDTVIGKAGKADYGIVGFLVLRLTGWRFPGDVSPVPPCNSPSSCVGGTVVRYTTTGVAGVKLVS
jgi:Flp pilus assembly protein TadG